MSMPMPMQMKRVGTYLALALLAGLGSALAHSIALWAEVRDNRVWVEAYDTEGNGIREARVLVKDPDGKLLLEGKTDAKGKFDFAPPNKNEMHLELILDEHHKSKATVRAEDLKDVVLEKPTP